MPEKKSERVPVTRPWRRDSPWSPLLRLLLEEPGPRVPPVFDADPRVRAGVVPRLLEPFLVQRVPPNWAEGLEFDDDARRSFRLRAMVPPPFAGPLPADHAVRLSRRGSA